jgi:hypothetical protein
MAPAVDSRSRRHGVALALVTALGAILAVPAGSVAAPRDRDRDGLTNRYELKRSHTSPHRADTDGDGLKDGLKVRRTRTNPRRKDTDRDGVADGLEVLRGHQPARLAALPGHTQPRKRA